MRVLHLVKEFSPPLQTFVYDLVCDLRKEEGISPAVACYKRRMNERERPFDPVYDLTRSLPLSTGTFGELGAWIKGLGRREYRFLRLCEMFRPDVIHAHFAWSVWDHLLKPYALLKSPLPVIVSTHGTDVLRSLKASPERRDLFVEFVVGNPVLVSVATNFLKEHLLEIGLPEDRICFIPYACRADFLGKRGVGRLEGDSSVFRFISNGRLVEWKGHKFLIEAFGHFCERVNGDAELWIIGEGPLRSSLEALGEALGVGERIRFLGWVSHSEVGGLLAKCDLFLQPSIVDVETGQAEAFGISILEAIAVGLPVVVTQTGGMPEVVGGECQHARIVQEKSADALFEAMRQSYEGRGSTPDNLDYAEERLRRYSPKQRLRKCLSAYRSVIEGG